MKTINNLFILEGMKDSIVLAGHRGLNRNVQYVNISDTPDVIKFLDKNHLLLTTGYPFKDEPHKMYDLIEKMHAKDCAGLVIKMDRFLGELPTEVKLLADELAFPIIDLPATHTLGELSRHILNYLNDHEAEQLYYALHIQKEFSDMMFKGYSLPRLIEQLSHFLSRPTLLLNHRGETIARSHNFRLDSLKQVEEEVREIVKADLKMAREGMDIVVPSKPGQVSTTFPVQTKRAYNSMLVIIDAATLPYPTSQMAIEQASNVISFTIIKEQAIEENTRLLKNNFFADLIEKRLRSEDEIISRSGYYGLAPNMNTVCIACVIDIPYNEYEPMHFYDKKVGELHNIIYDQLEDELVISDMQGQLFTKEKYFVMLIQFQAYTEREVNRITAFIEQAQKNIQTQSEFTVSFGVSNPSRSLKDIPIAYQEADEAITSGYNVNMTSFINFYKMKEIEELLSAIPKKDLKALYESTLQTLAYPETKDDVELVQTIETYLDCQCEIAETSRKLFIHRNTVKYRIDKAEEMLELSFRDPADSLRMRVALVIGRILLEED